MKRRGVETVRRMCRDIIHFNQPALDLLSILSLPRFPTPYRRVLSHLFLPFSRGHYYKQFQLGFNGYLSRPLEALYSLDGMRRLFFLFFFFFSFSSNFIQRFESNLVSTFPSRENFSEYERFFGYRNDREVTPSKGPKEKLKTLLLSSISSELNFNRILVRVLVTREEI